LRRDESRALTLADPQEADVDRFIDDVRTRFALQLQADDNADLVGELNAATEALRNLSLRHADARQSQQAVEDELRAARAAQAAVVSALRQAERELKAASLSAAQDKLHSDRMRNVVRVTQQSVLADTHATARLLQQRENATTARIESRLWDLVYHCAAVRPNTCATAPSKLQHLCRSFGLSCLTQQEPPAAPLTSARPGSSATSRSTATPRAASVHRTVASVASRTVAGPSAVSRPATAALVAAISERQGLAMRGSALTRASSSSGRR
jgi:hypothetical protein